MAFIINYEPSGHTVVDLKKVACDLCVQQKLSELSHKNEEKEVEIIPMQSHWNFQKNGDGKLTLNVPKSEEFDTDNAPSMPLWQFPKPKK